MGISGDMMANDDKFLISKYPRDENPDKWDPGKEYGMRLRYWDKKVDETVRRVRKGHSKLRWSFGMPGVSQERWDEIFGKKGE